MKFNLKDDDICPNCPHTLKDHIRVVPSRQRHGYREVQGKHRYGHCKYMHGVPGFFCKCEGPKAGKQTSQ